MAHHQNLLQRARAEADVKMRVRSSHSYPGLRAGDMRSPTSFLRSQSTTAVLFRPAAPLDRDSDPYALWVNTLKPVTTEQDMIGLIKKALKGYGSIMSFHIRRSLKEPWLFARVSFSSPAYVKHIFSESDNPYVECDRNTLYLSRALVAAEGSYCSPYSQYSQRGPPRRSPYSQSRLDEQLFRPEITKPTPSELRKPASSVQHRDPLDKEEVQRAFRPLPDRPTLQATLIQPGNAACFSPSCGDRYIPSYSRSASSTDSCRSSGSQSRSSDYREPYRPHDRSRFSHDRERDWRDEPMDRTSGKRKHQDDHNVRVKAGTTLKRLRTEVERRTGQTTRLFQDQDQRSRTRTSSSPPPLSYTKGRYNGTASSDRHRQASSSSSSTSVSPVSTPLITSPHRPLPADDLTPGRERRDEPNAQAEGKLLAEVHLSKTGKDSEQEPEHAEIGQPSGARGREGHIVEQRSDICDTEEISLEASPNKKAGQCGTDTASEGWCTPVPFSPRPPPTEQEIMSQVADKLWEWVGEEPERLVVDY